MNERPDPTELPPSFWSEAPAPGRPVAWPRSKGQPTTTLPWYDSIIDDILTNPGTTISDTAKRLGRSRSTVSAIVSSDLFRARWAQRRQQFSEALDERLTRKLAAVAEKGLDATIDILEKKRDSIPLPVLNETVKNSLDRLGYGPSPVPQAPPIVVNNNVVSAEALAAARENLRTIEQVAKPALPDSAGSPAEGEGEDGAD